MARVKPGNYNNHNAKIDAAQSKDAKVELILQRDPEAQKNLDFMLLVASEVTDFIGTAAGATNLRTPTVAPTRGLNIRGKSYNYNLYGEGETKGYLDIAVNPRFANGRTLSTQLPSGSANNIVINNSPIYQAELSEISRLAKSGTTLTYSGPAQAPFFNSLSAHLSKTAKLTNTRTFSNDGIQMKTVTYIFK